MIIAYLQSGCPRSRKMRAWFKDNQADVQFESLSTLLLNEEKLKALLESVSVSDMQGLFDLSAIPAPENCSTDLLAEYIQDNPSCIYKPLVIGKALTQEEKWIWIKLQEYTSSPKSCTCLSSCSMIGFCKMARKDDRVTPVLLQKQKNGRN